MYGRTAKSLHLVRRAGSHSTKGSGRGTVWWAPPLEPDILADQREQLVDAALHLLRDAVIEKREGIASRKARRKTTAKMQYALGLVKRNKISKRELENWLLTQSNQTG